MRDIASEEAWDFVGFNSKLIDFVSPFDIVSVELAAKEIALEVSSSSVPMSACVAVSIQLSVSISESGLTNTIIMFVKTFQR